MTSHRSLLYGNYIFIFPDFVEEPAVAVGVHSISRLSSSTRS